MKTSFYIALWILIYPLLGLLDSSFVNENSFLVALAAIFGISYLLNRAMPKTMAYARSSEVIPILEDVYMGNVEGFRKRLSRETAIWTFSSIYLMVALVVIMVPFFKAGLSNGIVLVVFTLLTIVSINRTVKFVSAKSELRANPTAEQCRNIATKVYRLNYSIYYEAHEGRSYQELLPKRPRHFKTFQIISLMLAVICTFLGLYFFLSSLIIMLMSGFIGVAVIQGMYFLYGSLAICFGVKDAITAWKSLRISTKEG